MTEFEQLSDKLGEVTDPDEMEKLLNRQAAVQDKIDHSNAWELDRQIEIAMDAMNLPPGDADVTTLSGGEKRRVALCKLLLEKPDLLLLDEPTNHLDAESVAWLERHLTEYPGTVVAVTHDRYFLDNAAKWILELDRGVGHPLEGNYSSWLEQKRKRLEIEEKQASARQKTLARELEWVRASAKARQAKSKARIKAYETMAAEQAQYEDRSDELEIQIPAGPRLGERVVEAVNLGKSYGDRVIFENVSFRLPPGGIVGIIGPNGAGKTTLLRMLMGQEEPDEGELKIGETVVLGYVDQSRDSLNADKTVYEEISGGFDNLDMGGRKLNSRAYVTRFNFLGPDQQKRVGVLSGGERNRVHLAKLLAPRLERAALGRTDQRPRRRHAAGARGSGRQFRRLRGRREPRPLVPRPAGDAHPGLRGRWLRPLVRGQLPNLRGATQRTHGRKRRRTKAFPL